MADMKKIEYTSSRLCFKASEIEPLQDTDVFIIRTPQGVFQFTNLLVLILSSSKLPQNSYHRKFPKTDNDVNSV